LNKKGSVLLTLVIVTLVLALIFINTAQNRILNEQGNELEVQADLKAYSFTEEMTAYASDALSTSGDTGIYNNAKKGFGRLIHECYSDINPSDFDEAKSNMLQEIENHINAKLADMETSELDFGSIIDIDAPELNEFDVKEGRYDCGFSLTFTTAEESGLTKENIGTETETHTVSKPHANAWAKLWAGLHTFDLTNSIALNLCAQMGNVKYVLKTGKERWCPSLNKDPDPALDTVTIELEDAKDALNAHMDYACDDGAGNNYIKCDYTVLCKSVNEMGCHTEVAACAPTPPPGGVCDPCDCWPEVSPGNCPKPSADCNECEWYITQPSDVNCSTDADPDDESFFQNDTKCEIGDRPSPPTLKERMIENCTPASVVDMIEANGCDTAGAPNFVNAENMSEYYTRTPVGKGTNNWGQCESATSDEGEVILAVEWTCQDENPAHCMSVEGTAPGTECLPLETKMVQLIYLHQEANPPPSPPTCHVPANMCKGSCGGNPEPGEDTSETETTT